MAAFDVDEARRWARFEPKRALVRRPDEELPFVERADLAGQALLLDTCVYVDQMQDRTPEILDVLIGVRQVNHSSVAVRELMHTVGVLDPRDRRTAAVVAEIRRHIHAMPPHRLFSPDIDVLGRAALLSGMLCRLQGFGADGRLRALQDCVLFLQAQKLGLTVLTRNIRDFDHLLQLIPGGRALFYRQKLPPA